NLKVNTLEDRALPGEFLFSGLWAMGPEPVAAIAPRVDVVRPARRFSEGSTISPLPGVTQPADRSAALQARSTSNVTSNARTSTELTWLPPQPILAAPADGSFVFARPGIGSIPTEAAPSRVVISAPTPPMPLETSPPITLQTTGSKTQTTKKTLTIQGPDPSTLQDTPIETPKVAPQPAIQRQFTTTEVVAQVASTEVASVLANPKLLGLVDVAASTPIHTTDEGTLMEVKLLPGADPLRTVKTLKELPGVNWAEPNYIYSDFTGIQADPREWTPNDPDYSQQFYHSKTQTPLAWDITKGTPNIVVAITDDGVAYNHPDLAGNIWTNPGEIAGNGKDDDNNGRIDDIRGWDFSSGDNDPNPVSADTHGTHVGGIVAARSNNGVGVAGTAGGDGTANSGARLMPVRFSGSTAWTSTVVANSYTYLANNGAKIANSSYNYDFFVTNGVADATVRAGFDFAYNKGVLLFNSAGNGNAFNPPRQVFTAPLFVTSLDSADVRSSFSNYGEYADV
ncbi:MAG: S8 family serine peptidase, partial [Gemmataceae bacterium]